MELDLLREHCLTHSYRHYDKAPESHTLGTYAWDLRQCPIPKCRKPRWLKPAQIPGQEGHLMAHDEHERTEHWTDALSKGYDSTTGFIVCPVCGHCSISTSDFREHLEIEHVLSESHRGFGAAIRSRIEGKVYYHCTAWKDVPAVFLKGPITCDFCSYQATAPDPKNHPGLLRPPQELFPYRRQILQLLPDFCTHPVFDDICRGPWN